MWQAKAKYSDSLRKELLQEYIEALRKYQPIDESYFYSQLRHFVLFRTLQVLGAYGFRGYFEKKPHFVQSVPYAIANLRELLKEEYPEYPYLCKMLRELTGLKQFTDDLEKRQLTVKMCIRDSPNPLSESDLRNARFDYRYHEVPDAELPRTESLKDTIERIMPYWESDIFPNLKTAHTLLVVAHGNSCLLYTS